MTSMEAQVPAGAASDVPGATLSTEIEPSTAPARPRRPSRRIRRALVALAVVFVVILGVVLGYNYVPAVTTCALGNPIGEYNVTSPQLIANVPDHGGADVNEAGQNWSFSSGAVALGNRSGSSGGFGLGVGAGGSGLVLAYAQPIFEVYSVHNTSGPASGGSHPCTQPYVAESVSNSYCGGGAISGYPIPDPSNDSVEPQVFNSSCPQIPNDSGIRSGGYMWVDNTFPANPGPGDVRTLNLCSWTSNFTQPVRGGVALPVVLFVPDGTRNISIQGYLWWVSTYTGGPTASYLLPHGSIWRVASIGLFSEDTLGLLPPGLLAFEEIPC